MQPVRKLVSWAVLVGLATPGLFIVVWGLSMVIMVFLADQRGDVNAYTLFGVFLSAAGLCLIALATIISRVIRGPRK